MIQKTFSVYSEEKATCCFFVEVGNAHIACWSMLKEQNRLNGFEFFTYNLEESESFELVFKEIKLHSVLFDGEYEKYTIIWENEDCICVPNNFINDDTKKVFLETITGKTFAVTEPMLCTIEDITVLFNADLEKYKVLEKSFPFTDQCHKYGMLLHALNEENNTSFFKVVFYQQYFLVLVIKNGQLQLIQRFFYQTAAEVVYHILNISQRLQIVLHETQVILSGFIDGDSNLYRELYKYIPWLSFEAIDASAYDNASLNGLSAHYFIPFFKYCTCV